MTKLLMSFCAAFLLTSPAPAQKTQTATLEVHVNYTGAGTVDDGHKIYVVLWDSPDFVKGRCGVGPLTNKSGTVKFEEI